MKQEKNSESVTVNASIKFIIKGAYYGDKCFPGLDDLLHEAERHPKAYNDMKRRFQKIAIDAIRRDLRGVKTKGRVFPIYKFYEPSKGQIRDYDNIQSAARKIINDALVKTQTIKDDKPQYLLFGMNEFYYTKDAPKIEVHLVEVEYAQEKISNISRK